MAANQPESSLAVKSSRSVVGEYSSACVCQVPGEQGSGDEAASVAGGAAGVVMQMRREEEQRQSQRGFYQ